ncbi:MAG: D-alanyl-D-alanine carboxypeptidase family protein [Xanthomonadales bacterium]|nr:D-alanyl-D-alanine carboxypeptidase family protein [Xanthomonadales bacterium]
MTELRVEAAMPAIDFYRACRYAPRPAARLRPDPRTGLDSLSMSRAFPRRHTRFSAQVCKLLKDCEIPADYGRVHRLRLQPECRELATIGTDIHGREQMLSPRAARAWYAMRNAAQDEGVELAVASAFRSVDYQASIIQRKRQAGQAMEDILRVSAAPGYSEHHSGRALDIATPDSRPLETEFEMTAAFDWLTDSAGDFGFSLSYPRNNRHGIAYEPWHWAWQG